MDPINWMEKEEFNIYEVFVVVVERSIKWISVALAAIKRKLVGREKMQNGKPLPPLHPRDIKGSGRKRKWQKRTSQY